MHWQFFLMLHVIHTTLKYNINWEKCKLIYTLTSFFSYIAKTCSSLYCKLFLFFFTSRNVLLLQIANKILRICLFHLQNQIFKVEDVQPAASHQRGDTARDRPTISLWFQLGNSSISDIRQTFFKFKNRLIFQTKDVASYLV